MPWQPGNQDSRHSNNVSPSGASLLQEGSDTPCGVAQGLGQHANRPGHANARQLTCHTHANGTCPCMPRTCSCMVHMPVLCALGPTPPPLSSPAPTRPHLLQLVQLLAGCLSCIIPGLKCCMVSALSQPGPATPTNHRSTLGAGAAKPWQQQCQWYRPKISGLSTIGPTMCMLQ